MSLFIARPRGTTKHLPSLGEYDTSNRDDYETMQSGTWNKAKGKIKRGRPEPEILQGEGQYTHCWCGLVTGHDWSGKSEGEPHPR